MKVTKSRRVALLNMCSHLMGQLLRDIPKRRSMIEGLTRIQKLLQIIHLESLLIHLRPICLEPRVQLLQIEKVLAAQFDRVPNLLDGDEIRVFDQIVVEDAKPELHAGNGVVFEGDLIAARLLETAAEKALPVIVAGDIK